MDPDPSDSCTFNIGIRSFVTELFGIWIGGDNFEGRRARPSMRPTYRYSYLRPMFDSLRDALSETSTQLKGGGNFENSQD